MSNYTKATNFATKDTLPTGDANKIVKGTEIDNEFNSISGAISSKADIASPTFTGTPAAPTATVGTNTTQIATTAFVLAERTNTSTLTNKTLTSPTINTPTISGGSISGITDLAVADGGTGSSTAAGALTNLGAYPATNPNGYTSNVGTVTSVATGNGLQGGTITSTGTLSVACPDFNTVGSYTWGLSNRNDASGASTMTAGSNYSAGSGVSQVSASGMFFTICNISDIKAGFAGLSGTWKWMAGTVSDIGYNRMQALGLICRVS